MWWGNNPPQSTMIEGRGSFKRATCAVGLLTMSSLVIVCCVVEGETLALSS